MKRFLFLALAMVLAAAASAAERHHDDRGGHDRGGFDRGHDRGRMSIGIGFPMYSGGYYEYRSEVVMVSPAYWDRQWVPPAYEIFRDENGTEYRKLIRQGYWIETYVPARYETRLVQVWVPSFGFGFRF